MANWQDPQTTGVGAATVGVPRAARDVGLRSYMLSVYNYMASGVLLTGIVAMLFANSASSTVATVTAPAVQPTGLADRRVVRRSGYRVGAELRDQPHVDEHRAGVVLGLMRR